MDGGCLSLWFFKPFDKIDKQILLNFASFVKNTSTGFSIRFKKVEIKSRIEQKKIIQNIGYLPTFEVLICGFADAIFLTTESILKMFDGYLKINIADTQKELEKIKGTAYLIKTNKVKYFLMNWEFISDYFNRIDTLDKRPNFSIHKYLQIQYFNKNNKSYLA